MGFSVLMSVYAEEKAEYLTKALDSVFCQTLMPDEVVLVEDGPLPLNLKQVIDSYQEKYLQLVTFQFEENVQLGRALAKGVELCSNELIARMDTDDIAVPERFERQYTYMKNHSEVSVCGGWMEEFDDAGTYSKIKQMPEQDKAIRAYSKYRNPVNHMTVMMRREKVLQAGNYRHFPYLEDYDLWSRMLMDTGQFYNIPEILVKMRNNDDVYERRGGWAYFKQYAILRKQQRKTGLMNRREYVVSYILTLFMTLQPAGLRKKCYRKFLRN